ncbi:MAG: methylenetetrahydrofolate--tRNA-(uracil(54)-C(5))-methyltransferase (FADH(2)-oxidizing) TrmFO [Bacilli bacterium]
MTVNVLGAGLAGSEAAYQLVKRGVRVKLYEMRPTKNTEVHQTDKFAELVCSNSFRAKSIENAVGLLKEEMRMIGSLIMEAADNNEVDAGGALAVDRNNFSDYITNYLKNHELVEVINEEVTSIPNGPTIIATGPLTSESLGKDILNYFGEQELYFYDAIAPIIKESSINKEIAYLKSRYDKGEASYYNCPMTKEEFDNFYNELVNAEAVMPEEYELKVFEGCMAVEDIAKRGKETLLFGPMKPVGLDDPKTGKRPYAVVQLRQDDALKTLYNIVGFQTHLKWPEQKRIVRMIPGLESAEIVRYGVMHRNTYINSPKLLNKYFQDKKRDDLFFAGQITGVEGYLESAASGMIASLNMYRYLNKEELIDFSNVTSLGSLQYHISTPTKNYVPMNVNFGLFEELTGYIKKKDRKSIYVNRSINKISQIIEDLND